MADFDTKAITTALAANRKSRLQYAEILRRPRLQRSPEVTEQQRLVENRIARLLTAAGLDRDELNELGKERQIALRRLAETQKAEIIKHSASASKSMQSNFDILRGVVEATPVPTRLPFDNWVFLDPFLIFSQSGDLDVRATIEPGNNVAKVTGEWNTPPPDHYGYSDVSFLFVWGNPRDTYTLVRVASVLGLNGYCSAFASGGFYANDYTWLSIAANLGLFVYTPRDYPAPPYQSAQRNEVAQLSAFGGGWFGVGELKSTAIAGSYEVSYDQFIIPPRGVAVFEVSLELLHYIDDGWIQVDFASGDFKVTCPAVILVVLS